jgi:Tol biopolymer transport system component
MAAREFMAPRALGLLCLGVTVAAVVVASAAATPPGENGRIAFNRYAKDVRTEHPSRGSIFTIGVDGKGERRVTRAPVGASDEQPDWSPDGSRIVFTREYDDKPFEIWSVRPDGSDLRQIDPGCPPGIPSTQICEEVEPAWSPDGKKIAFFNPFGKLKTIRGEEWIEVGAIAVMDVDGSNRRQLTQRRRPTSSEDHEPVWSPDGTRIAFMRWNSTASPPNGRAIFVVNADGSGLRQVTPWNLDAGDHPDWSPDGRRILFRSPSSNILRSNIYTVRPDGSGLTQLTRFAGNVEVLSSSYSPDGKWIVISRTGRSRLPDLFIMRSDGSGMRQLTRTASWDSGPDWGAAR